MTNEAVLKHKLGEPWDWIVADAIGIEKGTICIISGTRIAAPSAANFERFACVARREKIASDGRTRLSGFRTGIFDMKNSALPGISGGALVCLSGINVIRQVGPAETTAIISGTVIGRALEDIAGAGTGEILLGAS